MCVCVCVEGGWDSGTSSHTEQTQCVCALHSDRLRLIMTPNRWQTL